MWRPCDDGHEWECVDGWCGRYRCARCHVLGYRGIIQGEVAGARKVAIIPYLCPKCHEPTTAFHRKQPGEFRGRDGAQPCPRCRD